MRSVQPVAETGDLVVGDRDGVVVVTAGDVPATLELAAERVTKEAAIVAALQSGARTLDLLGLPDGGG